MLVREMMSTPGVLLTEDLPVREAARLLAENRCDSAVVLDANGTLAGIVTESDLLADYFEATPDAYHRALGPPPDPATHRVSEAMTRAVVTTAEGEDACELSRRIFETRIWCVPVLRAGTVVGLVRRRDVMGLVLRADSDIRDEVVSEISRRVSDPQDVTVAVRDGTVEVTGATAPQTRRSVAALERTIPGVRGIVFAQPAPAEPGEHGQEPTRAAI
ncbi:CBS domain-containing protein [Salinactinospora qingdaonensis]|uniref:CBS domain-containing protein n=1 Tax=Salinactinospora qingdaonensis TaxID=702744 RepID=A0ABP7FUG3_9ACTN